MLKIRLSRVGKKNQPVFRIVVTESSVKRDGKYVEVIGLYMPTEKGKKRVEIKKDRFEYWVSVGAQLSDGAKKLLLSVEEKKKIWPDKKSKKKEEKKENAEAEKAVEDKKEDKKEETKEDKEKAKNESAPAEKADEKK